MNDAPLGNVASPALRGGALALLAALLFGLSTPLIGLLGRDVSPLITAALLYLGAAAAGLSLVQPVTREARVRRRDIPVLLGMAACGAVIAPVALAWGLQHASAAGASLLLTLEALVTALLARLLYREDMGRKVWLAMLLITGGAAVLMTDRAHAVGGDLSGLLAVLVATAAWGADNTLSRALADRDPGQVVVLKGLIGAGATAVLAVLMGHAAPTIFAACGLLAVGATGYGFSLRFYLLAQRTFGAARTGSVFAFAPFIGALGALALGERDLGLAGIAAGLLMLAGVLLHLSESHIHRHRHPALMHEHAHTHDDGHHMHPHDPVPSGPHSHLHPHAPVTHTHEHLPDAHHQHDHRH